MLAIPLKRGEGQDLQPPLLAFAASPSSSTEQCPPADITRLHQLRLVAATVVDATAQGSLQALAQYAHHLGSVVPRLGDYEAELKVSFVWYDAFQPSRRTASTSWAYEWGAVLFNLAAVLSYAGATADRAHEEGIRQACRHFQDAAGVLQFLRDTVRPKMRGVGALDMSEEALDMLQNVMLAQAQACFYEKAARDRRATGAGAGKLKPGMLAKLAMQCHAFYTAAHRYTISGTLSDKIDRSWNTHLDFHTKYYLACAQYWESCHAHEQAEKRASGYGLEIGLLQASERTVRDAVASAQANRLAAAVVSRAEQLRSIVQRAHEVADRDNRTVYMEVVTRPHDLPEIGTVAMVRADPIVPPMGYENEHGLFTNLVPKVVSSASQKYKEAVQEYVREVEVAAMNGTAEVRGMLSSVGLPGSLESFKQRGTVPDSLWSKIEAVQQQGGLNAFAARRQLLEQVSAQAEQSLAAVDQALGQEVQNDDLFRQANPAYEGLPTRQLNQDIRGSLQRFHGLFLQARDSDAVLFAQLADPGFQQQLQSLMRSRAQLDASLPAQNDPASFAGGGGAGAVDTSQLERGLRDLAALLERREAELQQFKTACEEDKTAVFLGMDLTDASNITELVEAEKSKVEPLGAAILEGVNTTQAALLDSVLAANTAFEEARAHDPVSAERNRIIRELEQASAQFVTLQAQMNDGVTFYYDIQTRLSSLQQSANDLSFAQHMLRQEYEQTRLAAAATSGDAAMAAALAASEGGGGDGGGKVGEDSAVAGTGPTVARTPSAYPSMDDMPAIPPAGAAGGYATATAAPVSAPALAPGPVPGAAAPPADLFVPSAEATAAAAAAYPGLQGVPPGAGDKGGEFK